MLQLNHKRLRVWKLRVEFIANIYGLTKKYPAAEKYGLVSQMRRAAVSVSSNVSEGASRSSIKERKRFYEVARSSLVEVDTQLEISNKLNLISSEDLQLVSGQMVSLFSMLTKLKTNTR